MIPCPCVLIEKKEVDGPWAFSKLPCNQPVCVVNWLLPHSWNLPKATRTRLVYVSFISESTFPHWFFLIRPAQGCFCWPLKNQKSLWDNQCDPILQTNPGMMSFADLFFKTSSHPFWNFLPSPVNLSGCCTESSSAVAKGRTGCLCGGKIITCPTVSFSCDYFCSRKENLGTLV